ncbi:winged helix-turn-helix domain-containing protein [Sulfurospirillum diekertiae]
MFVNQIRKKIEIDPNRPQLLITISGVGYRFG